MNVTEIRERDGATGPVGDDVCILNACKGHLGASKVSTWIISAAHAALSIIAASIQTYVEPCTASFWTPESASGLINGGRTDHYAKHRSQSIMPFAGFMRVAVEATGKTTAKI